MFKRFLISGTKKDDVLTGTDDLDDFLFGDKGNDQLFGESGNDKLFGGKGMDELSGGNGDDKLFGGKGMDELSGGDGDDKLFGGKGMDELFGGNGDDKLFGGKGNDFLDGGAGSDYLFGDKGNDTFNFTLSENDDAKDYYDGGKGRDTLQLTLTTAQLNSESVQKDIADFEAFLARNADSHSDDGNLFPFVSFDLTVRNIEKLEIVEVRGNDAPVAGNDILEDLTATRTAVSPIKVAVVGSGNSSLALAVGQLEDSDVFDFVVTDIPYPNPMGWANLTIANFDVVVLGESGQITPDYTGQTAIDFFTALKTYVDAGGGVVTTGFFASALFGMRDGANNVDTSLSLAADAITPITSNPVPATVEDPTNIKVLPPAHPIVNGLESGYTSDAKWHEFAARVNEDEGAVQLATGANTMTAIAYDGDVGVGHGRTVYLGGTYLANSFFLDTEPGVGVRVGVSDQVFEQAIAWAAGARGPATVTIDPADLFFNDEDADSPTKDNFTLVSFTQPDANGASIELVEGILVYTLGAQSLETLYAGQPVTDSFDYTMSDGQGGFDTASVTLSIDTLL